MKHQDPYKGKHKCTGTGVCDYCKPNSFNGTAGEVGSTPDQDPYEAQQKELLDEYADLKRNNDECEKEDGRRKFCIICEDNREEMKRLQGEIDRLATIRVHHPVQPKTQVEKWEQEIDDNWKEINNCCKLISVFDRTKNCPKQHSDNCNIRAEKIEQLNELIVEATQPIHPRYPTGKFADDIENAPEYIKKSLFGYNFKKSTLLDKIKKLLR